MLIGLCGLAQSGKDTVADFTGFKKYGFADKVREALYKLNPIIHGSIMSGDKNRYRDLVDELGEEHCKKHFPEVRHLLQRMGTEVGREMFGENVWIDALFKSIDGEDDGQDRIIKDVRFDNEAQAIKDRGGYIVEVVRPNLEKVNNHSSEDGISQHLIDGRIRNEGSLEELEQVTAQMLSYYGNN